MLYAEDIANENMQDSAEMFYSISRTYIGGVISLMAIVMLIMFVISWVIHTKTSFGQKLKIIGTNYEVAKFSGINCTKSIIMVYIFNGLCSATAGRYLLCGLRKCASYENGTGYDFDALTAILFGRRISERRQRNDHWNLRRSACLRYAEQYPFLGWSWHL